MKQIKHTQGKWELEHDHSIVMGNQIVAKTIAPDGYTNSERIANAKLIVAAPELLSMLEHIELCLRTKLPMGLLTLREIQETINKATI